MKIKLISILMALLLAASFVACGNNDNTEESTTGQKINIQEEDTNKTQTTTEATPDQNEETTAKVPTVDRQSDPGEFTYVETNDTVYVINKINSVTFRSGSYAALGEFKNGTVLERIAVSEDGRWSKVIFNGVEGYVATRNLTSHNPEDNNFEPCDLTLTVTKDKTVNVRISPEIPIGIDTTDEDEVYFNVVAQIFEGFTFKVIAVDSELGWYKIDYTPADGVLAAGYEYEFFVKANSDYFVSVQNNGEN